MTLDRNRHRLFVEGVSDASVINKLVLLRLNEDLARAKLCEPGLDVGGGGFEFVHGQFDAALATKKLERVGGVIDRDGLDGKPDRWPSMRALLQTHGIEVGEPSREGLVAQTPWGARIGLWMMPDDLLPGDLEHFIEALLPPEAPDRSWAEEASRTARAEKHSPFKEAHARKASLHTWLAWRDPPGLPYGTAIESRQIGTTSSAADAFVEWFRRLFLAE